MLFLIFGFSGHDWKESANVGGILSVANKIEGDVSWTDVDTGGDSYLYAIHNEVKGVLTKEEYERLERFFLHTVFKDERVADVKIKNEDGIYIVLIDEYKKYVEELVKEENQDEDEWV